MCILAHHIVVHCLHLVSTPLLEICCPLCNGFHGNPCENQTANAEDPFVFTVFNNGCFKVRILVLSNKLPTFAKFSADVFTVVKTACLSPNPTMFEPVGCGGCV